jgi:Protein of unknown function (DUF3164).
MDIKNLTAEEKAALKAQLAAEEKAEKAKAQQDKETYKLMQHEFVETTFPALTEIETLLATTKIAMFEEAKTILDLKKQVFVISDDAWAKQQSHSISNSDFSKTIVLGHNIVDGWDNDLSGAGIARVNDWLAKQASPENEKLVSMIVDLLKPNKDGILKASRVLDLSNQANNIGDQELIDAVAMIREAYKPKKTSTYIIAKYKGANGEEIKVNLSMSQA